MDVYPSGHPVMHTPDGVGGLRPTRYDISGFGYDIRDVVQVLNLTIRRKNARSYDVDCPFCNHKTGKLNINIEKMCSAVIIAMRTAGCWICIPSCITSQRRRQTSRSVRH